MTSRDTERPSRDPNTLRVQYRENSWRCHLATIANYIDTVVCSEAVRSAILATTWLLVLTVLSILSAVCFGSFLLYRANKLGHYLAVVDCDLLDASGLSLGRKPRPVHDVQNL